MNRTEEQIIDLIRARKMLLAHGEISRYLKRNSRNFSSAEKACDWYLKLGHYPLGWRLMKKAKTWSLSSTEMRRSKYWSALFLNLIGAPQFARAEIRGLRAKTKFEKEAQGIILLSNFESVAALPVFEKRFEKISSEEIAFQPMKVLSYADAIAHAKSPKRAAELAQKIAENTSVPLNQAICWSAIAEYACLAKDWERTLKACQRAEELWPDHDQSADAAILWKWKAVALGKLGKKIKAKQLFLKSFKTLKELGSREEAWFHVLYLKDEILKENKLNRNWLAWYPGLCRGFLDSLNMKRKPYTIGSSKSSLSISKSQKEFEYKNNKFAGLPKELELLALLRWAGPWGVSKIRAQCVLWPDEFGSIDLLGDRTHHLLKRVRDRYRFDVSSRNDRLFLHPKDFKKISVSCTPTPSPGFLDGQSRFKISDLLTYYRVSRSGAKILVNQWKTQGWIHSQGKGKSTDYIKI